MYVDKITYLVPILMLDYASTRNKAVRYFIDKRHPPTFLNYEVDAIMAFGKTRIWRAISGIKMYKSLFIKSLLC